MNLKQLFADDDAVSPVIGVILMVAITVILAAVIASFVLGLGDQNNPAPTVDFNIEWDGDNNNIDVTHGDGDEVSGDNVYLRGSNIGATTGGGAGDTWNTIAGTSGAVKAGQSLTIGTDTDASDDYVLRIVWEDPDSDQTSTLDQSEGPAA